MTEYINKEELTNYIKRIERKLQGGSIFPVSLERIDEFSTIDIVHCGECKWFDEGYTKCKMGNINGGNKTYFCADGERKEDGE